MRMLVLVLVAVLVPALVLALVLVPVLAPVLVLVPVLVLSLLKALMLVALPQHWPSLKLQQLSDPAAAVRSAFRAPAGSPPAGTSTSTSTSTRTNTTATEPWNGIQIRTRIHKSTFNIQNFRVHERGGRRKERWGPRDWTEGVRAERGESRRGGGRVPVTVPGPEMEPVLLRRALGPGRVKSGLARERTGRSSA